MSTSANFTGLIQRISEDFIRGNIYMVDKPVLARALINIEPQYQEKIFRNMSDDGAEVKRLMNGFSEISAKEIETAQQQILVMASQAI